MDAATQTYSGTELERAKAFVGEHKEELDKLLGPPGSTNITEGAQAIRRQFGEADVQPGAIYQAWNDQNGDTS